MERVPRNKVLLVALKAAVWKWHMAHVSLVKSSHMKHDVSRGKHTPHPTPPPESSSNQLGTKMQVTNNSVGKESACSAGDPSSIPGSGRSSGEGIGYPLQYSWGFPGAGKESACDVGDLGSIPGLERCPGEGKGYLLQYSGLENSMDYRVHGVAKGRT